MRERIPLNRERVVTAAVAVADQKGAAGVTMRAVAGQLGVEAMSLYNHVAGREDILDGMVDAVFAEIDLPVASPGAGGDWAAAMRSRAGSARAALRRHPWAVGLMDSRSTPGPSTLRHHDAVLGALRAGGFSPVLAARAISLIDSYVYGFVLQELSLPYTGAAELDQIAGQLLRDLPAAEYPHLAEVTVAYAGRPDFDQAAEFEYGLALVLGALHPDEART
ncbi:TetR/AcrR family transcriptional regulator C-terminal domain-containing protein [Jiangella mangrovi]|uniref:AcrR family transcriptional regulator n=1 Tax=Jiangella mangrovi TaxID=1524084 RepID=A0A7W9GU76_9ACTN|nr:TetR/AcrR family transcriptional regulator C-terminal domain-containing protein [Jiangella mangrovi]MBB5790158.1 AcrR family transcriptional regulator [Jiangella mangrovi]